MVNKFGPIEALGTIWWVEIFEEIENIHEVEVSVRKCIEEFENNYSRFKADSVVTKLNLERIYPEPTKEFVEIVTIASELYGLTNGLFNPFLGGVLESRGYGTVLDATWHDNVRTDLLEGLEISSKFIKLPVGSFLDIGGFGKGYLIKKISHLLSSQYLIKHFLINGGGDILLTSEDDNSPIEVLLRNPSEPDEAIGIIQMVDLALASSSSKIRNWEKGSSEGRISHIIDPRDLLKYPASHSFVVSADIVLADALATILTFANDGETLEKVLRQVEVEYLVLEGTNIIISNGFPRIR